MVGGGGGGKSLPTGYATVYEYNVIGYSNNRIQKKDMKLSVKLNPSAIVLKTLLIPHVYDDEWVLCDSVFV